MLADIDRRVDRACADGTLDRVRFHVMAINSWVETKEGEKGRIIPAEERSKRLSGGWGVIVLTLATELFAGWPGGDDPARGDRNGHSCPHRPRLGNENYHIVQWWHWWIGTGSIILLWHKITTFRERLSYQMAMCPEVILSCLS